MNIVVGSVCLKSFCHLLWGCRAGGCHGCLNKFKGEVKQHKQPSQNVPAAGVFAAYNEMSAAYFIVKFTTTPAILPTTQKHFDWAA